MTIRYGDYESATGRVAFRRPVAEEREFKEAARERFGQLYQRRLPLRLLGVELAPLVGLAHGIVDLVDTGRTLRDNGLVEREELFASSARLIANRVSQTLRAEAIDRLADRLDPGAA